MTKLLITVSILAIGSWLFARRRWYAPSVLLTGIWLFTLISYVIIDRGFHPLKPEIIDALTIWITGFTVTTWIVQSIYLKPLFKDVVPSTPVRDLYYYFTLATLPLMIWAVVMVVRHTGGNPFSALRDANVRENDQGIRTTSFFVIFWMVSYIMELRVISKSNRGRVIVLFLINLFYVIVSMGKMNLMILFLSTVIILSEKNIVKLKHMLLIVPVLLGLMLVLQSARGSLPSKSRLGAFCSVYICSSLSNLNTNVEPHSAEQPGENTFRLFYAIKHKIDKETQVIDPILDYSTVTIAKKYYRSNTYTALYPFYKDFGMAGVWIFSIVLGLLFGSLFKLGEDGSICALVLYAILAGCILMQMMGDTVFSVLSQNIQYLIATLIPFVMSKYRLLEKKTLPADG